MMTTSTKPFPHGEFFGCERYIYQTETGLKLGTWMCRFELMDDGRWKCQYVDEKDEDTVLFEVRETPRAAFEALISMFKFSNGGVYTPTLEAKLPEFRAILDERGLTE